MSGREFHILLATYEKECYREIMLKTGRNESFGSVREQQDLYLSSMLYNKGLLFVVCCCQAEDEILGS